MYRYYIGIDCGVNTGYAVYDCEKRKFTCLDIVMIHQAMNAVLSLKKQSDHVDFVVVIEDARQIRFGTDPKKAQGAGSVKRDCKIWEDFCIDYDIPFMLVKPDSKKTKVPIERFVKITGCTLSKSKETHDKDAALLVWDTQITEAKITLNNEQFVSDAGRKKMAQKYKVKIKNNALTS